MTEWPIKQHDLRFTAITSLVLTFSKAIAPSTILAVFVVAVRPMVGEAATVISATNIDILNTTCCCHKYRYFKHHIVVVATNIDILNTTLLLLPLGVAFQFNHYLTLLVTWTLDSDWVAVGWNLGAERWLLLLSLVWEWWDNCLIPQMRQNWLTES